MYFLLCQTENGLGTQYVYEIPINQGYLKNFLLEKASAEAKIRSFVVLDAKNDQRFGFCCAFRSANLQVVVTIEFKVVLVPLYIEFKYYIVCTGQIF